ncbi:MAG: hypothetical protein ABI462_08350 [Ignavibacteria bacterium]
MKKFNFKINNFYSIFNQMNSEDKNKHLDSFLDSELGASLQSYTPSDFTLELMKRVELEKEFTKQDVKAYRIAKYFIGGFVFLLSALIVMFAVLVNAGGEREDVSFFNGIVDRFSDIIESVSFFITENLGFAFDFQTGIILLLVMVFVFIFSFADKVIFRKGYK